MYQLDYGKVIKLGGYSWEKVRDDGQWWRYFTGLYVARLPLDALIFLWLFFNLGPMAEKALGTLRFIAVYLLAGAGGIALAEVFDPGLRLVGTITCAYALLGAGPGLVLGITFSFKKMLFHPLTRSAAFWIFFSIVLVVYFTPGQDPDIASNAFAAGLGFFLGAAFGLSRSKPVIGWPVSILFALAATGAVVTAAQGMAWREGEGLTDRGRPPSSTTGPRRPVENPLGTEDEAQDAASQALAEVAPFLDPFGPLPRFTWPDQSRVLGDGQVAQAQEHLAALNELALDANLVGFELEPARIRLNLLLGNFRQATKLARLYYEWGPRPEAKLIEARLLEGLAYMEQGGERGLTKARDDIQGALDNPGVAMEYPEAVYYLGELHLRLGDDVASEAAFDRFLTLTGEDPRKAPPYRRPLIEQAKVQLDR